MQKAESIHSKALAWGLFGTYLFLQPRVSNAKIDVFMIVCISQIDTKEIHVN